MLVVDSLTHAFGENHVLRGVYLRVEPGEVVGVVGLNGCGKTTMLRAILGTLRVDQMHMTIADELVDRAYRRGVVSYLPQDPYLPRRMRVGRVLSLALPSPRSRYRVRDDARVAPNLGKRVSALSGGEQRYLEVLLAACFPSRFALLDEPFTEIEPIHRDPLRESIRATAREHERGFIITDHAYRDVLATADRVLVLAGGELRRADGEEDLRRWGYTPGGRP
ncbi:MAG: ATP-binding cassette domain-containing protein [Spirochaetota bacterium]